MGLGNEKFIVNIHKASLEVKWDMSNPNDNLVFENQELSFHFINKKLSDYIVRFTRKIEEILLEKIHLFDYGLIIHKSIENQEISIYTDIYGITPNYFYISDTEIFISNSIDKLASKIESPSFNMEAIADYFLVNYPIQGRTLLKEVNKMRGGQKIVIGKEGITIENYLDWNHFENWNLDLPSSINSTLSNFVSERSESNQNIFLGLSGGFDSKTILAACSSAQIEFKAYTFGEKNNLDVKSAQKTAEILGIGCESLDFSTKNHSDYVEAYNTFLERNENLGFPPTLMNYVFVNNMITNAQIFTGKMGGEIIVGPSLISGLVFSNFSNKLLKVHEFEKLKIILKSFPITNYLFKEDSALDQYCAKLLEYKFTNKKQNVLLFLLTETYPNFFGQVNNTMTNHEILNPFLDIRFVQLALKKNSLFSGRNSGFISRLKARTNYYHWIKSLDSKILKTPLDRGFNLNWIDPKFLYIIPALNYIYRKLFISKSKKSTNFLFDFLVNESKVFIHEKSQVELHINGFLESKKNEFNKKEILNNEEKIELIKLRILEIQMIKFQ
jgi:hypothetical protein